MEKVNLKTAVEAVDKLYVYEKIGKLNDLVLSVVNVENRYLEIDDGLTQINSGEMIIVPKGVRHRPVVKELTKF